MSMFSAGVIGIEAGWNDQQARADADAFVTDMKAKAAEVQQAFASAAEGVQGAGEGQAGAAGATGVASAGYGTQPQTAGQPTADVSAAQQDLQSALQEYATVVREQLGATGRMSAEILAAQDSVAVALDAYATAIGSAAAALRAGGGAGGTPDIVSASAGVRPPGTPQTGAGELGAAQGGGAIPLSGTTGGGEMAGGEEPVLFYGRQVGPRLPDYSYYERETVSRNAPQVGAYGRQGPDMEGGEFYSRDTEEPIFRYGRQGPSLESGNYFSRQEEQPITNYGRQGPPTEQNNFRASQDEYETNYGRQGPALPAGGFTPEEEFRRQRNATAAAEYQIAPGGAVSREVGGPPSGPVGPPLPTGSYFSREDIVENYGQQGPTLPRGGFTAEQEYAAAQPQTTYGITPGGTPFRETPTQDVGPTGPRLESGNFTTGQDQQEAAEASSQMWRGMRAGAFAAFALRRMFQTISQNQVEEQRAFQFGDIDQQISTEMQISRRDIGVEAASGMGALLGSISRTWVGRLDEGRTGEGLRSFARDNLNTYADDLERASLGQKAAEQTERLREQTREQEDRLKFIGATGPAQAYNEAQVAADAATRNLERVQARYAGQAENPEANAAIQAARDAEDVSKRTAAGQQGVAIGEAMQQRDVLDSQATASRFRAAGEEYSGTMEDLEGHYRDFRATMRRATSGLPTVIKDVLDDAVDAMESADVSETKEKLHRAAVQQMTAVSAGAEATELASSGYVFESRLAAINARTNAKVDPATGALVGFTDLTDTSDPDYQRMFGTRARARDVEIGDAMQEERARTDLEQGQIISTAAGIQRMPNEQRLREIQTQEQAAVDRITPIDPTTGARGVANPEELERVRTIFRGLGELQDTNFAQGVTNTRNELMTQRVQMQTLIEDPNNVVGAQAAGVRYGLYANLTAMDEDTRNERDPTTGRTLGQDAARNAELQLELMKTDYLRSFSFAGYDPRRESSWMDQGASDDPSAVLKQIAAGIDAINNVIGGGNLAGLVDNGG